MDKPSWCYYCCHGAWGEDAYENPCIWCTWHEKTIWKEGFWSGCEDFCGDLEEAWARIDRKRAEA